jgi:hypothetical protein
VLLPDPVPAVVFDFFGAVVFGPVLGAVLVFLDEAIAFGAAVGEVFTFFADAVGLIDAGVAVAGFVLTVVGFAVTGFAAVGFVVVGPAGFDALTCVTACEGLGGLFAPPRPCAAANSGSAATKLVRTNRDNARFIGSPVRRALRASSGMPVQFRETAGQLRHFVQRPRQDSKHPSAQAGKNDGVLL